MSLTSVIGLCETVSCLYLTDFLAPNVAGAMANPKFDRMFGVAMFKFPSGVCDKLPAALMDNLIAA